MPKKAITPETRDQIIKLLNDGVPGALQEWHEAYGELTLSIDPTQIREVCLLLRNDRGLRFDFLSDLTAVDYLGREPRFIVVYHLFSTLEHHRIRLRAPALGDPPAIETVSDIWLGANWHERECWDLLGVVFQGHPDLRRIMLPPEWQGHPLRKDYETTEGEAYDYLSKSLADE
jgi:NADH-quinone oxidoreductase subunit C